MWIVQAPVELFSSQWKPPSTQVKMPPRWKAAILGKGLTLEIDLTCTCNVGPLFQGLVCPKYSKLEVKDPQVMILDQFCTIPQMYMYEYGLKSLFSRISF